MNKHEKLVVSAYTGFLMCRFDDLHKYIEELLGRPVFTHELVTDEIQTEIREKTYPEFLKMCSSKESKFYFEMETNLECDQELYGIVAVSRYTYDGVRHLKVHDIDWTNQRVDFLDIDSHTMVSGHFSDINSYLFKTKEEAEHAYKTLEFGLGLY